MRVSAKALWLGSNMVIATYAWVGSALAAVQPSSAISAVDPVVIRGSSETIAQPSGGDDPPPVVLRGSRPPRAEPPTAYACPAGYLYDPSSGCVVPGYTYEPYGYDAWPYWGWGFDGFDSGDQRHRFPHGFPRHAGRFPVVRFGHRAVSGFGHAVAHIGGFGRR